MRRTYEAKKGRKRFLVLAMVIMYLAGVLTGLVINRNVLQGKSSDKTEETKAETQQSKEQPAEIDTNIEEIIKDMSLEEKVYQMMFVTPESITGIGQVIAAGETTKNALEKYPVGGIIYFSQNLQDREQVSTMLKNSQSYSKIPIFTGVDEEGGRVARLGSNPDMGVTKFDSMKEIAETGDKGKAYEVGATLGKELRELGFNVDFAPVADIIVNKNNTEIGDRSFGSDPQKAGEMVAEVVKGLRDNGVAAVVKHFPGHGSTESNSHTGYSESVRTLEQLREEDFVPFKMGIEAGTDFTMISHATFTNVTKEKCPASLSKEIISDLLINELGFKGIVITDAFNMGAITDSYSMRDASVKAVEAGVDMILMPNGLREAVGGITEAVENGKISEERINESVRKILTVKKDKGLF